VIGLAQRLVALREVVAFLHFEALERLDQLVGVVAAVELRRDHGDLYGVHGLVVRLHVAIGQWPRRVDLGQSCFGFIEEPVQIGSIKRPLEYRDVAIDGDEPFDLVAEGGQIGRFANGAVAGPFVLFGNTEVVGLITNRHAVFAEEDAEQAVEIAGDLR
jgi:hypothetical protein